MNSKERVYAAIRGQKTDRVPIFMWYSGKTAERLAAHLKIKPEEAENALGNDIFQDWLTINREMQTPCGEGKTFTDEWGITWRREGEYNTPSINPLANAALNEIAAYKLPDPDGPKRYEKFLRLKAGKTDKFIGADVSGTVFDPAYHLRGMSNLFIDLMSEDGEADLLIDKVTDFALKVCLNALEKGADWIWLGDDFGTQKNMFMSPEVWRKYFKPRIAKIISSLRAVKPDVIVAYHSCGSIFQIIGDFVEIGLDVLNPIQESAFGMSHEKIRKEFPNLTMFCGLDTQQYLVNAKPGDVYRKTKEKIRQLGKNGKFIFGASHTIQSDVPVENILAMLQAAKALP